ncbi:hypothetical protein CBM2637_A200443 [Cupriavidus taiwanensis]|nr:hypothetical protein CBM2637_A200443 [Cupriavidus taiwanensis]
MRRKTKTSAKTSAGGSPHSQVLRHAPSWPRGMPRKAGPRASVIALSRGCAGQADKAMAFAWVGWLAGRGKIRPGGRAWRRRRWHGKTLARSSDCGQGRRSAEPGAPGGSSLRSPQ